MQITSVRSILVCNDIENNVVFDIFLPQLQISHALFNLLNSLEKTNKMFMSIFLHNLFNFLHAG